MNSFQTKIYILKNENQNKQLSGNLKMKELLDALEIVDYKELLSAHICISAFELNINWIWMWLIINTEKYNWIWLNINEYD